jgi:hypothetical protein
MISLINGVVRDDSTEKARRAGLMGMLSVLIKRRHPEVHPEIDRVYQERLAQLGKRRRDPAKPPKQEVLSECVEKARGLTEKLSIVLYVLNHSG